jgi:hypothetical protein
MFSHSSSRNTKYTGFPDIDFFVMVNLLSNRSQNNEVSSDSALIKKCTQHLPTTISTKVLL